MMRIREMKKVALFLQKKEKNLHMSEKSCNFAAEIDTKMIYYALKYHDRKQENTVHHIRLQRSGQDNSITKGAAGSA